MTYYIYDPIGGFFTTNDPSMAWEIAQDLKEIYPDDIIRMEIE